MACILITSHNEKAGRTMLSAGLAKIWQNNGRRVGYLKITDALQTAAPGTADPDCAFMRSVLAGSEAGSDLETGVTSDGLVEAYRQAAIDKDLVIVECLLSVSQLAAESLNGRILAVHDFGIPLTAALPTYQNLGKRLIGVTINKVPRRIPVAAAESLKHQLSQAGLPFLGMIPEDRLLMTISVADLAAAVQGQILNNSEKAGELVENLMLGSSTFDRGAAYYSRKINKAVLVWGDRLGFRQAAVANYPLFALSTSTRCIVISHAALPVAAVAQKAAEAGVPLISSPGTLPQIVEAIEKALPNLRFQQVNKLPRLIEILSGSIDLKALEEQILRK